MEQKDGKYNRGDLLFMVRVLGLPIEVKKVKFGDDADEQVFGQYDSYLSLIELDHGSSHLHQRVTLLHELLHVFQDYLGLDNVKHKDVYSISQALFCLLTENRHLVEWLMEPPSKDNTED
tara:strand:- start:2043 stop:2402 length:360 start_codon:yes stop_codon:yes gene_type:complete